MNLLLDARKKLQQAHAAQQEDHAPATVDNGAPPKPAEAAAPNPARQAGHNLFAAKSAFPPDTRQLPNRNLLYALGGTVVLLGAGMAYLWHADSTSGTTLQSLAKPNQPAHQIQPIAVTVPATQAAAPDTETAKPDTGADSPPKTRLAATPAESVPAASRPPPAASPQPDSSPVRIDHRSTEPQVEPLLNDAYFAYRYGMPDEAQRLYLAMLRKDTHNSDALLGLAAIAQQQGDNHAAEQYFGLLLALDPRNAAANAGMAALSADENYSESRLKLLLREQRNSAILHFALGNLYAKQSRWGEAQQAYFNACTLEPGNAEFVFNLAVSLDHLGQRKPAAEHYRRALQLDASHDAGFDHAQITLRAQELAR